MGRHAPTTGGIGAVTVFEHLGGEYEEVVFFHDPPSGLRAIVAIHSTALGPALGGTRFHPFAAEQDALRDVLRLARAMTYKAAAAGLDLGGGKAVIVGDPSTKSEELLRAYGRFIDTLGGRYITAEDIGTSRADMDLIRRETRWVTGVSEELGGAGDISPYTAFGVLQGMRAAAEEVWGQPSLRDRRVAIQGVGKVGYHLAKLLVEEGVEVVAADVSGAAVDRVAEELGAETTDPDKIHAAECDVFAPCALGGALRDETIPELRCRIVAGAANNQLERPDHADALEAAGVLYAPDFVVNAGGLIDVADELQGWNGARARARVAGIYDTMRRIFAMARERGENPTVAAERFAEERIRRVGRLGLTWSPGASSGSAVPRW